MPMGLEEDIFYGVTAKLVALVLKSLHNIASYLQMNYGMGTDITEAMQEMEKR